MLAAYPQVVEDSAHCIRLWIGVLDTASPSPPNVLVSKAPGATQRVVSKLRAIRDQMTDAFGRAVNHRTVLLIEGLQPDTGYELTIQADGQAPFVMQARTMPAELPQGDRWFNILLCSCYYQQNDQSGRLAAILGKINKGADPVHMTLMMGDQIYGDVPSFVDLPGGDTLATRIGQRYLTNFAGPGRDNKTLATVLRRAPAICVADDHEYWNNYPFKQAQVEGTWFQDESWSTAARALYVDYQLGDDKDAGAARDWHIGPLHLLAVDMRSDRDKSFDLLVGSATEKKVKAWVDQRIADVEAGKPTFCLICSGQSLLSNRASWWGKRLKDAELSNWTQFDHFWIRKVFEPLAAAGIPVIYATGDVHWGRIAEVVDVRSKLPMLHEVICSAATRISFPSRDPEPDQVPTRMGQSAFLKPTVPQGPPFGQGGNQIAILSLQRAGGGIDFRVTYYAVKDPSGPLVAQPSQVYKLRNLAGAFR